ncbi:hypothetical protein C8J57DRAFT_1283571 [Mycena rebaudengoi]|nr:hypothetical protein C8J57DRAFT_1283571 [Mycena rebaudengoi]
MTLIPGISQDRTGLPFTPFAPVIYPLIITYSHQLRSLKLILDTRDVSQFNGIRVSFPILHHLSLHIDLAPADCDVVIFNHLPSLQHLQVLNKGPISNVDIYPSLITLRTDDISIPEFYRVLATCSHLVEFRCRLKGEMNDDPMPITSPRLESLTLSLGDMQGRVLTSLIFPKLQNLSLKGLSALTFENVRHFILQSSRCLESLELFVHNWTGEQMEELLASIPSLEMLKIYPTARNSGPLLKCLISPIILPRLKALSITSTAMFRLRDCRIIISLIKSRHNAGIGLASFKWEHIRAYRYTEDQEASEEQKTLEIANHLQELTKLGFKRSFSSGSVHAVHDSAGEEYCSWDTPLDL